MNIILCIVISYLIGSVPTAYILSGIFFQKDIRQRGSGNIGTLNFLRVTGSKSFSIIVLLIDVAKGYLALWISSRFINPNLLFLPAVAVILGHIFPIWLKGKGGRGLASLAGVFLFVKPEIVLIWLVFFLIIYMPQKKYILAGCTALFLINLLIVSVYNMNLFILSSTTTVIVLMKYIPRLKQELSGIKVKGD